MFRFWKKLTTTGKLVLLIILTLPVTIPAGRTLHYVIVNGEEIENFKPYTIEQCRKDFAKFDNPETFHDSIVK